MEIKYLIIFLLGLLLPLTGCDKDISEPNPPILSNKITDEEFKKFLLEKFDANKNGVLDFNEVNSVKEIYFTDKEQKVKSFKGIEIFTNLEKLSLQGIVDSLDGTYFANHLNFSEKRDFH